MIRKINIFAAVLLYVCTLFSQDMDTSAPTEYQIKAAFLYKFTKFIEWPAEAFSDDSQQIVIGVLGRDPFGLVLDKTVEGKFVHGRKVVVKRFRQIDQVQDCQILFICSSERKNVLKALNKLINTNILTIGDTEGYAEKGCIINFIRKEKKIHFEINVKAAKAAHLKLSSKLLNLARIVGQDS